MTTLQTAQTVSGLIGGQIPPIPGRWMAWRFLAVLYLEGWAAGTVRAQAVRASLENPAAPIPELLSPENLSARGAEAWMDGQGAGYSHTIKQFS